MSRNTSLLLPYWPRCAMIVVSCVSMAFAGVFAGCNVQPTANGLAAEKVRVAYQSPCAQNAIECTSSWPTAIASVATLDGQTVTSTDTGFLIETTIWSGVLVQLVGDNSTLGNGATVLIYSWTASAAEDEPCVLTPGDEFAAIANPTVRLLPGFHYIRLTVENDIIRDSVESPTCGVFGMNIPSFDFIEMEIEIRN